MLLHHRLRKAGSPPKVGGSFIEYADLGVIATPVTTTGRSLGAVPAAGERRFIVLVIGSWKNLGTTSEVTSCTIAGVSATKVVEGVHSTSSSDETGVSIWYAEVPTGTTGTLSWSYVDTTNRLCVVSVYRLVTGPGGLGAITSATDTVRPLSFTISSGYPAFVVGGTYNRNGGFLTWTYLTEDVDDDTYSSDVFSSASKQVAAPLSGQSVTATSVSTGNEQAGAIAVFNA